MLRLSPDLRAMFNFRHSISELLFVLKTFAVWCGRAKGVCAFYALLLVPNNRKYLSLFWAYYSLLIIYLILDFKFK